VKDKQCMHVQFSICTLERWTQQHKVKIPLLHLNKALHQVVHVHLHVSDDCGPFPAMLPSRVRERSQLTRSQMAEARWHVLPNWVCFVFLQPLCCTLWYMSLAGAQMQGKVLAGLRLHRSEESPQQLPAIVDSLK